MGIKEKSKQLLVILCIIVGIMYSLAYSGIMRSADDALAQFGRDVAGYAERIYYVKAGEMVVLPIIGEQGVVQPIYMDEQMLSNDTLMLGIYMATYNRENKGSLLVELKQEGEKQIYKMEMEEIEDNSEIRLIFDTEYFREGEIEIRIYSLDSTGKNCVALYAVEDTDTYSGLYLNGEKTERNAIIQVYVPSKYAKSKFEMIWEEQTDETNHTDTVL